MNPTATIARTPSVDGSHWYTAEGEAMYTVIAKGSGQPRPTTLADARKLGLLPSVTTILKALNKPALNDWLCEQTALAVLTTPRKDNEPLDAFVQRVLHDERIQDQEADAAKQLGTDMHEGLEALFRGERITDELRPWIEPAYLYLKQLQPWSKVLVEQIVVGPGFAGKVDWQGQDNDLLVVDFKTSKKLPEKGSWNEHRLQLAAYARAIGDREETLIRTANLYISTADAGKFVFHENPDWRDDYANGFKPLLAVWQWMNNYKP